MIVQLLSLLVGLNGALALAILVVLLFRVLARLLPHYFNAQMIYRAWLIVPLLLLVYAVSQTVQLPQYRVTHASLAPITSVQSVARSQLEQGREKPGHTMANLPATLLGLYGQGMLYSALLFLFLQRRFVSSLGELNTYKATSELQTDEAYKNKHNKDKNSSVFVSSTSGHSPVAIGLTRPMIVVPADFAERYDLNEQSLILAHEQMHLARHDLWVNAFVAVMRCAFWINPLVHLAARLLRHDQEIACDAAVIAQVAQRAQTTQESTQAIQIYAGAILKTAMAPQLSAFQPAVACTWWHWRSHPLKERIMNLQRPQPTRLARTSAAIVLTGLTALSAYATISKSAQTPKPAANQYIVEVIYTGRQLNSNSAYETKRSQFAMLVDAGKEASFKSDHPKGFCDFKFTVAAKRDNADDKNVEVNIPFECDGKKENVKLTATLGRMASFETFVKETSTIYNVTMVVSK
jgi:bla regulator protein blaR1